LTEIRDITDSPAVMDDARRAFAAGDISAAEIICKRVISSTPENAEVWALLTETALQRGRSNAAMVCASRAVALRPQDPTNHILHAKCLFFSGAIAEACAAAETALSRLPASKPRPADLDALGAIFGLLGQHTRAETFAQKAVAAEPNIPQHLFNLAATERMIGALGLAEAHCDAAIALQPNYCLAHYLRVDLRTQTRERNHIADMEAVIRSGALSPSDEVLMHFALGKEYEDVEEHVRAFDHVEAACALHRNSSHYDPLREIAEIDHIIQTQTRDWLDSLPTATTAAAPIFVVGLPRTGTTLVERIVGSHSFVMSAGETGTFSNELRRALQSADGKHFALLGRRYLDSIAAFGVPRERHFIDKTLQNYLFCGFIHAVFPRAKIILARRHPLDAGWAMYKAHFRGQFSFSYDLTELADYLLAFCRLAAHWKTTLPAHAFIEIAYEDIVREQTNASRRLIEFVDLPWQDGVLRFHESKAPSTTASAVQIRRPVYATSVGKWRHHVERLEPLRVRLATQVPWTELA
jgi:tetratricopeptide (TPR) repeat protein